MPAIKATNSKGLKVENCFFSGFDTDIELENVEDFMARNNSFSGDKNPSLLLQELFQEIHSSNFDESSKGRLAQEIKYFLSSKDNIKEEQKEKISARLKYVSEKAVDIFIQVSSAVIAGLVLK